MNKPILISVAEFCRRFGMGKTKAYELFADGAVATKKLGRRRLVELASAESWADALPGAPPRARARSGPSK